VQNFIGYHFGLIYHLVADISANIRDEISDISAYIVTYLDNYFFCVRDYFIFYVHCGISVMFLCYV